MPIHSGPKPIVLESQPTLPTSHVILCLRSRMTSTETRALQIPSLHRTRSPSTRAGPLPSRLEHLISCAARSRRAPSHRICTMIFIVDVWSCVLGVPWRSVVLGLGCSSPARFRRQIPFLRPPCPHRLSHRRSQHSVAFLSLFAALIQFRSVFSEVVECWS